MNTKGEGQHKSDTWADINVWKLSCQSRCLIMRVQSPPGKGEPRRSRRGPRRLVKGARRDQTLVGRHNSVQLGIFTEDGEVDHEEEPWGVPHRGQKSIDYTLRTLIVGKQELRRIDNCRKR